MRYVKLNLIRRYGKDMVKNFNENFDIHFGKEVSWGKKVRELLNVIHDYFLYGASITDYFELGFYKMSRYEKNKYMTFSNANRFARAFDDLDKGENLSKKTELMEWLESYLKREQLNAEKMTEEEFSSFCKKYKMFLFKPAEGSCGMGIEKETAVTDAEIKKLYKKYSGKQGVIDECVFQHKDMAKLHPASVNTVRVFSVRFKDEIRIFAAALRMGNNGLFIDNFSAGGVGAPVDINTGLVTASAQNGMGEKFSYHPYTGEQIVGIKIPNWDKVLELVNKAAMEAPLSYIGWDVAIRDNDCVIIEANYHPMIHAIQTDGGKKAVFDALLTEKEALN